MKLFQLFRPFTFWTIDLIKGRKIKTHYNDIKHIYLDHPSSDTLKRLDQRLNSILSHAVTTTRFYEKSKSYIDLSDFPVITKNIIKENFNELISDKYSVKDLKPVYTSGSTGIPFKVLWDKNKRNRNTADSIYFGELGGFHLGMKLYCIRAIPKIRNKSRFTSWSQNMVNINVFDLSSKAIDKVLSRIEKDNSNKALIGYSSAYEAICHYLDKISSGPLKVKVDGIISMAEALSDYSKESMMNYFGRKVVARYSNQENGIFAQQSVYGNDEYYLNHASYFFEILNLMDNSSVKSGEPGRIVITDLYNYGMPIIRYDTGDIGVISKVLSGKREIAVLKRIEGRQSDMIYSTTGNLVSHFSVSVSMRGFNEIKQYQFIQLDKKQYKLVLNCDEPYNRVNEIIKNLKGFFGDDATIEVEYVSEIPVLSSGKRKRVVNMCSSISA